VKTVRKETQKLCSKWAWALNFWGIFKSGSVKAKRKEKNCDSISLSMSVTILGTHGSIFLHSRTEIYYLIS
jgi:hypothetical protein